MRPSSLKARTFVVLRERWQAQVTLWGESFGDCAAPGGAPVPRIRGHVGLREVAFGCLFASHKFPSGPGISHHEHLGAAGDKRCLLVSGPELDLLTRQRLFRFNPAMYAVWSLGSSCCS